MRVNVPVPSGERFKLLIGGVLCGGGAYYLLTLPNGTTEALVTGIVLLVLAVAGLKGGITGRQIL